MLLSNSLMDSLPTEYLKCRHVLKVRAKKLKLSQKNPLKNILNCQNLIDLRLGVIIIGYEVCDDNIKTLGTPKAIK